MEKKIKVFSKLDPEKRDRIINSALEEFSNNSYDKASTNNIVKSAGISKGALYHYFKTKKSLYDFLEAFAIEKVLNAILDEMDWEEKDLFERIKQILVIKSRVLVNYPNIVSFSKQMYRVKSIEEIKKIITDHVPNLYEEIYHRNIDFSVFKEDVNIEKAIKMTEWTMEKLGEEWMHTKGFLDDESEIDFSSLIEEIDIYLDMLKKTFYK